MSTGGLEPPQLSPHAPQACVSTIPPHRLIFNYFVILLLNCHFLNTVSVLDVVFDNPLLERYLIVLVGRVPHQHDCKNIISQNFKIYLCFISFKIISLACIACSFVNGETPFNGYSIPSFSYFGIAIL